MQKWLFSHHHISLHNQLQELGPTLTPVRMDRSNEKRRNRMSSFPNTNSITIQLPSNGKNYCNFFIQGKNCYQQLPPLLQPEGLLDIYKTQVSRRDTGSLKYSTTHNPNRAREALCSFMGLNNDLLSILTEKLFWALKCRHITAIRLLDWKPM